MTGLIGEGCEAFSTRACEGSLAFAMCLVLPRVIGTAKGPIACSAGFAFGAVGAVNL